MTINHLNAVQQTLSLMGTTAYLRHYHGVGSVVTVTGSITGYRFLDGVFQLLLDFPDPDTGELDSIEEIPLSDFRAGMVFSQVSGEPHISYPSKLASDSCPVQPRSGCGGEVADVSHQPGHTPGDSFAAH